MGLAARKPGPAISFPSPAEKGQLCKGASLALEALFGFARLRRCLWLRAVQSCLLGAGS